jgi:hypothetical protein
MKYRILLNRVIPYTGSENPETFQGSEDIQVVPPKLYDTFEEAKAANVQYCEARYQETLELAILYNDQRKADRSALHKAIGQKEPK